MKNFLKYILHAVMIIIDSDNTSVQVPWVSRRVKVSFQTVLNNGGESCVKS